MTIGCTDPPVTATAARSLDTSAIRLHFAGRRLAICTTRWADDQDHRDGVEHGASCGCETDRGFHGDSFPLSQRTIGATGVQRPSCRCDNSAVSLLAGEELCGSCSQLDGNTEAGQANQRDDHLNPPG